MLAQCESREALHTPVIAVALAASLPRPSSEIARCLLRHRSPYAVLSQAAVHSRPRARTGGPAPRDDRLNPALDADVRHDPNGVVREYGDGALRLLGCDVGGDAPRLLLECVTAEDRERVASALQRAALGDAVGPFRARLVAANGTSCAIEWTVRAGRDARGEIVELESAWRELGASDVADAGSARRTRHSDAGVLERSASLRQMLEAMPHAALLVADDLRIVAANEASERLFLRTRAELCNRSVPEIVPGFRSERDEARAATPETGIRGDGTRFPIDAAARPIRTREGVLTLVTFADLSPRRRAESELLESRQRLALALEVAHMGWWEWDPERDLVFCSEECARHYGSALPGSSLDEFLERLHPDERAAALLAIRNAERTRGSFAFEARTTHSGERAAWLRHVGQCLESAPGRAPRVLATVTDVTERHATAEALRQLAESRQVALDVARLGTWQHDIASDLFTADGRAREHIGLDREEVPFPVLLATVHPDDRARMGEAVARAHAGENGGRVTTEFRHVSPDGRVRWLQVEARIEFEGEADSRRPIRAIGTTRDITESRRAEDALRERYRLQAQLARVAETAPGALTSFAIGPDGREYLSIVGPHVEQLFGYTAEQLTDAPSRLRERIHPDDLERSYRTILESARTLEPWRCEYRVLHPTRGEIWVEGHSQPERQPDGGTLWSGFLRDITERKHAEEQLRTSRAQLIAALEVGRMGTWIYDGPATRMQLGVKLLSLFGVSAEEPQTVSFQRWLEFAHPDDRERISHDFRDALERSTDLFQEFRALHADGSTRWLSLQGRIERDAQGGAVRALGIGRDITHQKLAEEGLVRAQKLEALGTLAGGIAHDFNNILFAIGGNIQLTAAELPEGHPSRRTLAEVEQACARAAGLVKRILAFSRPHPPHRETLRLGPVLDEAIQLVRATLPAMIQIRTRVSPDLPPVLADSNQFHQLVVNLVTNAAHAIGSRPGAVDVSLDAVTVDEVAARDVAGLREGRHVVLTVLDDGVGMSRATLERIFDPFFTTKPPGEGTGLGLSIVHGIVRGHDGAIAVESAPGAGAKFRIYLPAVDSEVTAPPRPNERVASGGGRHLLVVDDEEMLVALAVRMMERLGYRVTGIQDPARALVAFRADPAGFDAAVVDFSMPGMSGIELARHLLALRSDLPVLLTSGYLGAEDERSLTTIGIRAVVPKPFTAEALGDALARLFASA